MLVVKNLCLPIQYLPFELTEICKNESGVILKPYNVAPDILIGQDNINLILNRNFIQLKSLNMIVSQCLLGWSLHGNFKDKKMLSFENVNFCEDSQEDSCCKKCVDLDSLMKNYFDLDSLGISTVSHLDRDKKRALDILNRTKNYVNGAWEIGLLWKADNFVIPNSRDMALRRLYLMEKKLDSNKEYADMYHKEMNRLFELKYAVVASNKPKNKNVWYLPHFGV